MPLKSTVLSAFILLLAGTCLAQTNEIPRSAFSYQNWTGSAFYSQETGAFTHCVISAKYKSGDTLYFSLTSAATVVVGVGTEVPVFTPGRSMPVAIYVDRRRPFIGRAIASDEYLATLEIDDFQSAMQAFQRGYNMVIEGDGMRGEYSLAGTFRALEAARQCAIRNFEYAGRIQPATPQASPVDRTILFQVATGLVRDLQADDFRYYSSEEIAELGMPTESVFWESEGSGIVAGTSILPFNGETSLKDTDASDTGFLASLCEGDYASSARDASLEGLEARELRVLCTGGDETTETYLNKVWFGENVLYTLISFKDAQNTQSSEERRDANETAALTAAKFAE